MDNTDVVKETTLTVDQKPFILVLPYLGSVSLQTRHQLKKSLKTSLIVAKCKQCYKTRLGNNFHFKDQIPKDLTSGVICKCHFGLCNESYYGQCVRYLNVKLVDILGYHHLSKNKLSLITALQPIFYYLAIIQYRLMILKG